MEIIETDINILKQQRNAYLSAASKLDAAIRQLEGNPEKPIDWKNSALDCIKNHGFPLRTVDILYCMAVKEPDKFKLTDFIKRRNYVSALSIALNNLCDKGVLDRTQIPGYKGYFYGLKNWFIYPWVLDAAIDLKLKHALYSDPMSVFSLSRTDIELDDED
jgi:hypothetical protein